MILLQRHINPIKLRLFFFILSCLTAPHWITAQDTDPRLEAIEIQLDTLAAQGAPLQELVTISMAGKIQDFVAFLAESTQLNISIEPEPEINAQVAFTFTDAAIKDVILHLCEAYSLEVKLTGNIIRLIRYEEPPEVFKPKEIDLNYASGNLSLNLRRDTLDNVVRAISRKSNANIVVEPLIRNTPVSAFMSGVPIEQALEQLALNNDLSFENRGGFYYLGAYKEDEAGNKTGNNKEPQLQVQGISVKKISGDRVKVKAIDAPVLDIIREVAIKLDADYALLPEVTLNNSGNRSNRNFNTNNNRPNSNPSSNSNNTNRFQQNNANRVTLTGDSDNLISIQLKSASFEDILKAVTKNSDYTYELINGLATIGTRNAETMRETKVMQLRYRSARDVLPMVPEELLLNVDIDTLLELNSLILSGSKHNINETMVFLNKIDKLVPVVTIELTIVDVQTNLLDEFGIEAGSVPGGKTPGGIIVGGETGATGIDFTPSTNSINRVLGALAGANIINLGRVSADFFLSLKAIEENGLIEVKSTPKLSTLNNHPANMSIGQTRYYQIEEVNFPGVDNPIPVQSQRFESIDANLAINITPIVSGDEQVTLEIYFEQSEFVAIPPNEPPPTVSRKFDSSIRIRNGEMIVLGGLERESNSKTTRGVPGLSRLPIIGWLFGKKRKEKVKEKLLVFIKPTITY